MNLVKPALAQIKLEPKGTDFDSLPNITIPGIVSGAINLVLVLAAVFFFMLVWGGIRWIMSQGDKGNVENARNQITNALIGLAIIFAAWAIMKLIETLFGVSIFNLSIPTFL